ncbi:MAG: hypothetical protein J0J05_04900 [Microbacterium sp.]|uniref:hypothetical protein n=1 Tax=Microbacterium sp. TaxID=51671 RepID=UPI001ACE63B4|nr:hypothetical protein [Microbacterium sp.]MBN9153306.1 hypothetical protein [Microbacterium sp.]
MSASRIVVIELASAQRIHSWRDHCTPALGLTRADHGPLVAEARFVWQLVSGNNRAIARGYRAYTTATEAQEHAAALRAVAGRLAVRTLRLSHDAVYSWVATHGADIVLMSARSYSTVRDVRDSIVMALATLPEATAGPARRETDGRPSPLGVRT